MYIKRFKDKKQFRLPHYDYSSDGFYFVTVCTKNRKEFFGEIKNNIMGLNEIGCLAAKFWQEIPNHFENVNLDIWQIMPNHLHGIVIIGCDNSVGTRDLAFLRNETTNKFGPLIKNSLSSIIHGFKSSVKRWCNQNGYQNFAWQPRFHERVIRNDNELNRIREYIIYNPQKWEFDRNNPKFIEI